MFLRPKVKEKDNSFMVELFLPNLYVLLESDTIIDLLLYNSARPTHPLLVLVVMFSLMLSGPIGDLNLKP